ncbi:MAG TPA: energy transducer TonB [Nitrospiraceae bacterium]|nr:energy transducer TonB [Nitrospiraceae bacterium]
MAQTRTIIEDEMILHRPPVKERPIRSINTMPDYGWLAESLWVKVEHLKRYPPIARMNRWEGKVVLQAAIREDGRLLDVDVVESSGYSILDQDAVDVLKRVSPLTLKYALEQPRVILQIPISYRLD